MALSEEIDNETAKYHLVRDYDSFTIDYQKQSGEFSPSVSINIIERNELREVAVLSGDLLAGGSLRIADDGTYIVSIAEAPFDFNFDLVQAEYTIALVMDE
jgi:hypothetical protein